MRNNDLPTKGDQLFIPEPNGTCWLPNGVNDFFQISEGYRMAATFIYNEIKKREWVNKPYIVCVMVFCFRQFLEVRLKELAYMGRRALSEKPDFQKVHQLDTLFNDYVSNVLPKLDRNYDPNMVDVVRGLINEFNSTDPQSMNFRYPVDKNLKASLNKPNLDIDNFKNVMDKLSNYFDAQLELVKLLEDYNDEMAAEYASYFAEYY